jgi:lysozyme
MINELDENGFAFLADHEGLRLSVYADSVGVFTIGYGSTYYADGTHVAKGDPDITKEQAQQLFNDTSKQYADAVSLSTKPALTQNQFNALFSLCYNIGTGGFKNSTVLKVINGESDADLRDSWLLWDKAGGKVNSGLNQRRIDEYDLYMS